MYFELEPIPALAPGRFTLIQPEVFDGGVFGVTMTSNHTESVHGVYNVGFFFGSLTSGPHFHVKGILKNSRLVITLILGSNSKPFYVRRLLLFALTAPIFLRQLRGQVDRSFLFKN